jgi:hypothetical protein
VIILTRSIVFSIEADYTSNDLYDVYYLCRPLRQEGVSAKADPLAPKRKTMKARIPILQVQPLTAKTKGNGVSEEETNTPKGNGLSMQLVRQESP